MPARLNHTIVRVRDREASARFLVEVLGLPEPTEYGPFLVVQVDNDVSLDYAQADEEAETDGRLRPPVPRSFATFCGDSPGVSLQNVTNDLRGGVPAHVWAES